jgi:5-methylcytosine-specific restriction enzyme A
LPTRRPRLSNLPSRIGTIDQRSAKPPDKTVDAIYVSPEYRAWRDEVITRAGGRCEWAGCGRAERRMFADHKRELKDAGAVLDPANGQCLCGSHHTMKTAAARAARMAERHEPTG